MKGSPGLLGITGRKGLMNPGHEDSRNSPGLPVIPTSHGVSLLDTGIVVGNLDIADVYMFVWGLNFLLHFLYD